MLDNLKIGAGAAAGAVLAALAVFAWAELVAVPGAREEGRHALLGEQAASAMRAELDRKKDDAFLQDSSDFDLCVDYLAGRKLPIDPCDGLGRVRKK